MSWSHSGVFIAWYLTTLVLGVCAGVILLNESVTAAQLASLLVVGVAWYLVHNAQTASVRKIAAVRELSLVQKRFADITPDDMKALDRIRKSLGYQVWL